MPHDKESLVDAFEDLLDRERTLLLSGSFDQLARLSTLKADLTERLATGRGAPELRRLQSKAERNARLLEAAGAGIRSVLRRINAVREGPEPLSTYSASGRRSTLGAPAGRVEKRA